MCVCVAVHCTSHARVMQWHTLCRRLSLSFHVRISTLDHRVDGAHTPLIHFFRASYSRFYTLSLCVRLRRWRCSRERRQSSWQKMHLALAREESGCRAPLGNKKATPATMGNNFFVRKQKFASRSSAGWWCGVFGLGVFASFRSNAGVTLKL